MIQPKYKFGQEVIVELKAKYTDTLFIKEKVIGLISRIHASGTSKKDSYNYGITRDMPRCYHGGEPPFIWIMEDDIKLKGEKE